MLHYFYIHENNFAHKWHSFVGMYESIEICLNTQTKLHACKIFRENLINKLQLDYKFSFLTPCCNFCMFHIFAQRTPTAIVLAKIIFHF